MPDISMCPGKDETRECPNAKICHRATATPDEFRQAYFAELPLKENGCEYFWPNGLHDHVDCPCDHPPGTKGPCAGCNCADYP